MYIYYIITLKSIYILIPSIYLASKFSSPPLRYSTFISLKQQPPSSVAPIAELNWVDREEKIVNEEERKSNIYTAKENGIALSLSFLAYKYVALGRGVHAAACFPLSSAH